MPTSIGSQKKAREFQKNIYLCLIDYSKAFDCVDHNKLWEILKEMGISDHLTCLLRNLYAGQEATVRTRHGTMNWLQIGKNVSKLYIVTLLFSLYSEFSSVVQSCPTLCDPMDCSTPGFHHKLPELSQVHVHRVGDATPSTLSLSSPSPPTFNFSQHQGLVK